MTYLITLYLKPPDNTLQFVKRLSWTKNLMIDDQYGLILISPKRSLYTIRVTGELPSSQLLTQYPDVIKGIHADVRIESFSERAK